MTYRTGLWDSLNLTRGNLIYCGVKKALQIRRFSEKENSTREIHAG